MADIILIYPKTGFDIKGVSIDIPLSLLAISSTVADKYKVEIIDQRIDTNWQETLRKKLRTKPLCVGISSMTGPQIGYGLEAAKIVKEMNSSIKVVWGGVHATLLPEQTIENSLIDIIAIGEGEITFKNLIEALNSKKKLSEVNGIVFKENGSIIKTQSNEPLSMDDLPELPYHLLDIEKYIGSQGRFHGNMIRSLIFISSRGCPWGCTYCCNPKLSKRRWRGMSAENTYERVKGLVEKFNLEAVTFHDEEFLVDKDRAEEIASLIGGQFKWWIQARMDRLKIMDLQQLDRDGLSAVQPGIESGSDRILQMIKKGEKVSDITLANKMLARTNIIPLYNFMMGFPTETVEELMQSVDLALKLLKDNPKSQMSGFYVCIPYPGTELFDFATKEGFKTPGILEGWINYNRQHLMTPWIKDKIKILESLMISSKFIDGTRLKNRLDDAFNGVIIPSVFYHSISRFYEKRWQEHIFDPRVDKVINRFFLALFHFSQIEFVYQITKLIGSRKWQLFLKRILDFLFSLPILISLMPLLLPVVLITKINMHESILEIKDFIGIKGRRFKLYKFRKINSSVNRILETFNIYNVPILYNILKGDMSIVGPQPVSAAEYLKLKTWQKRKTVVKPGVISLWQIFKNTEKFDFDKITKIDLEYIDNFSLWLDIKVIFGAVKNTIFFSPATKEWIKLRIKRFIDVVFSFSLLVILSPLFLVIAILVKISSPGPIFYPWRVLGKDEKDFVGYKFRSMFHNAEKLKPMLWQHNEMKGPVFKMKNDPRTTPLGRLLRKYSLDELPQLYSVLKGDMALVGPRPPSREEFEKFELWQKRKLTITPGITCLWQINGRNAISDFNEWVKLDLEYIDKRSLRLDFEILVKTVLAVLKGTGV